MQQSRSEVTERDGLVELSAGSDVLDSPRYNHDIAPTRVEQRTWNRWHITALWIGMSICVPTYTLGGVLTAYFGLSVGEALLAILLANLVVLIPLTLNAFAGTRYGIPFPVLLRASFGIIGSNVPCLIRAVVACGWFGIQTLFGGLAIHLFLGSIFPAWKALGGTGEVIGFLLFWGLNLWVVLRGAESIKWLETLSAPLLVLVGLGLLVWALPHISVSELLAQPPKRPEGASVTGYFMAGLTAMVGFWATLSLNIPDFSRYARSQKDQILGQIFGLPLTMFLFAALGVVMTAASASLVGETMFADQRLPEHRTETHRSHPRRLAHRFHRPGADGPRVAEEARLDRFRPQPGKRLLQLAARLLQPARADRGDHGGGLLPGAQATPRPRRTLPRRRLPGLELARLRRLRGAGGADRHGPRQPPVPLVLRLRLVHRLAARRRALLRPLRPPCAEPGGIGQTAALMGIQAAGEPPTPTPSLRKRQ